MFNLPEKFVIVDGYKIPADKAEEYRKTKERMEKEAAMNVALGRNKLKEYILATNGYDEYAYQQLLKEYKIRHENK